MCEEQPKHQLIY